MGVYAFCKFHVEHSGRQSPHRCTGSESFWKSRRSLVSTSAIYQAQDAIKLVMACTALSPCLPSALMAPRGSRTSNASKWSWSHGWRAIGCKHCTSSKASRASKIAPTPAHSSARNTCEAFPVTRRRFQCGESARGASYLWGNWCLFSASVIRLSFRQKKKEDACRAPCSHRMAVGYSLRHRLKPRSPSFVSATMRPHYGFHVLSAFPHNQKRFRRSAPSCIIRWMRWISCSFPSSSTISRKRNSSISPSRSRSSTSDSHENRSACLSKNG